MTNPLEIKLPKNNLQNLIEAIDKARVDETQIFHNGAANSIDFIVVSFTDENKAYNVSVSNRELSGKKFPMVTGCSCPEFQFRRNICKHMVSVAFKHNIDIAFLAQGKFEAEAEESGAVTVVKAAIS